MLADATDTVIANYKGSSGDTAARVTAITQLAPLIERNTSDKRALPILVTALFDENATVRDIAAYLVGVPGVVDWKLNPCLRNTILVRLQYLMENDVSEAAKAAATRSYDDLMKLGLFDKNYVPADEKCINDGMDVKPGVGGGTGLVPWDPNAKPASSKMPFAQKFALAAIAMTLAGGIAAAIFWPRRKK